MELALPTYRRPGLQSNLATDQASLNLARSTASGASISGSSKGSPGFR